MQVVPARDYICYWKSGKPPEPLDKWLINILITILGLLVNLSGKRDYLAVVYPLRALVLCTLVVVLIFR